MLLDSLGFFTEFPRHTFPVAFHLSRLTADGPRVESRAAIALHVSPQAVSFVRFHIGLLVLKTQFQLVWVRSTCGSQKSAHVVKRSRRYLHLLRVIHRCLPFSPFMSIFRRCSSSRPLTASGRCVSRRRLRYSILCHALINEKNAPSEDWSIQSWRSQKVVAIGCIHPTCSGVVERCQLLRVRPSGPDPGSRCLRLGECFICQRYCRLTRRPPVSLPPSHIPVFLGGTILALATHPFSVVAPAGRTCVRDPRIVDSEQPEDSDAFRRACTGKYRQAVFGERVIPALRVHRCWRAARLQPIRRLGRPLRPLFSPFSLDADFLLLLWDIDIQPTFGELFGCI
jgi:hypothetical protein